MKHNIKVVALKINLLLMKSKAVAYLCLKETTASAFLKNPSWIRHQEFKGSRGHYLDLMKSLACLETGHENGKSIESVSYMIKLSHLYIFKLKKKTTLYQIWK